MKGARDRETKRERGQFGLISDDMKNVEMTESRRPPEGRRRAPLLGLPGGPTGRIALPVRLGYHLDNRCWMRMERLAILGRGADCRTRYPGCGYAC